MNKKILVACIYVALISFLLLLSVARRGDLVVSTREMTEEAAQVGAVPEWEDQRKTQHAIVENCMVSHVCYSESAERDIQWNP